jgi:hypothetical protein
MTFCFFDIPGSVKLELSQSDLLKDLYIFHERKILIHKDIIQAWVLFLNLIQSFPFWINFLQVEINIHNIC